MIKRLGANSTLLLESVCALVVTGHQFRVEVLPMNIHSSIIFQQFLYVHDVPAFAQHTFECKHSLTIWCNVDYGSCSDFYILPFSKIHLKCGCETIHTKWLVIEFSRRRSCNSIQFSPK